ncbi:MAG TPA: polysaccharide biosynthesis C-terminal domain-containing protein, partial [Gaiellaceae bacterium]|nr:polysaccharide biosynthesis C-terminal domain-containing protein [Gaiellaceae bacterium]
IPRYGVTGAACSTTASVVVVNVVKLLQVRALFGINPFRAETGRALVAGAAAAAAAAPVALLVSWPSPLLEIVVTTAVLVPLYAAFFWRSAAGAEERELLRLRVRPAVAAK